jgi:hypothetical protein
MGETIGREGGRKLVAGDKGWLEGGSEQLAQAGGQGEVGQRLVGAGFGAARGAEQGLAGQLRRNAAIRRHQGAGEVAFRAVDKGLDAGGGGNSYTWRGMITRLLMRWVTRFTLSRIRLLSSTRMILLRLS